MNSIFHININRNFSKEEVIKRELNLMRISLLGVEEVDFCNMPKSLLEVVLPLLKLEENNTLDFFKEIVLLVAKKEEQMKLICLFQLYEEISNKGVLTEKQFLVQNGLYKTLHNEWIELHKKLVDIFKN